MRGPEKVEIFICWLAVLLSTYLVEPAISNTSKMTQQDCCVRWSINQQKRQQVKVHVCSCLIYKPHRLDHPSPEDAVAIVCNKYNSAYKIDPTYSFAVVTIIPAPGGGVRAASQRITKVGRSAPSSPSAVTVLPRPRCSV